MPNDLERLAELNRKIAELTIDSVMFGQIINVLPDGLVIIDEDGEIKLVNQQIELLFGYPRAQLIGERLDMLMTPETQMVHAKYLTRFFANPTARPMNAAKVLPGKHRTGRILNVQISIGPLVSEQGVLGLALVRKVADGQ